MVKWLKDAVFYEIYPQSFQDSNGDGIGDIDGITSRLDYIKDLGFNALWINPCFDSPFKDAGYDVRNYKKVAARYGSNEDLYRLFGEAHKRGIHVLLDLVPGHTSEEHPWFQESGRQERNAYSDRYVWADYAWAMKDRPYVAGECERDGIYMLNFFKSQPALNYGFGKQEEDWQMAPDSPAATLTREAMKDVMRFWMDRGCDGFRVDMADSLVKNDTKDKAFTQKIWQDVRQMFDKDYPECVLISEWDNPSQSIPGGFHSDFTLDNPGSGYRTLFRDYRDDPDNKGSNPAILTKDHSFFRKDAGGNILRFLDKFLPHYEAVKGKGYISLISGNHDTPRLRRTLDPDELKVAYGFLFTMPGVPFMYYGDEIGMRYIDNLPTKEGGYSRTGTRTPMQWDHSRNMGFSTAFPEDLYLPLDPSDDAPCVEEQLGKEDSLLETVRSLIALRHSQADLQADGDFAVAFAKPDCPLFLYQRGNLLCGVNPSSSAVTVQTEDITGEAKTQVLFLIGEADADSDKLTVGPQSFVVLK